MLDLFIACMVRRESLCALARVHLKGNKNMQGELTRVLQNIMDFVVIGLSYSCGCVLHPERKDAPKQWCGPMTNCENLKPHFQDHVYLPLGTVGGNSAGSWGLPSESLRNI